MPDINGNAETVLAERMSEDARTLIKNTIAIENLTEQLKQVAGAMHTPPCRHAYDLGTRLTALEKANGKFSEVFWKVIAALATAAALAIWKIG